MIQSLIKPIPKEMRAEMSSDIFYKKCCLFDEECSGRIEWHHNLTYASRRVNAPFCILPVCHFHHFHESRSDIKEKLNWIMLNRATSQELLEYSKAINYIELKKRLNVKYNNIGSCSK